MKIKIERTEIDDDIYLSFIMDYGGFTHEFSIMADNDRMVKIRTRQLIRALEKTLNAKSK